MKFILLLISIASFSSYATTDIIWAQTNEDFKQTMILDEIEIHFAE